ncbi:response regulator [Nonomuraea rhizosphaerae]|uniref:response regulator n=1 Tax=Nonomuraea rhizosphaerae TaxID=2665663 RepID=UPI001C5F89CE|nr:response regulator [Nonomuraea rhizosphaerae]
MKDIRVLVVDDDFMVARIHSGYVSRVPGFKVVASACNGAEALTMAAELRPDLVLLDIYLPDISGLEVLKALHDVDVLMISAARDLPTVREAMRGGAVNYLIKPFTAAALAERLQQYADTRRRLTTIGAEVGQDDVDRLFGTHPAATPLPKGLSSATCSLVAGTLKQAGRDLSAAETASIAGLSRVSARRYLEYLCVAGRAELRPRYGTAGRPEHRYRWIG